MTSRGVGLLVIAAGVALLAACSSSEATTSTSSSAAATPASSASAESVPAGTTAGASYLFTVSGQSGSIDGIGEDTGEETLTLTLDGVRDHATQFADRPIREAFVLSTTDFTRRWGAWFADSPPNAVLSFLESGDATPRSIVVQLTDPIYDADAESLTYTARHLHRQPDLSPDATEEVDLPQRRAPETFGAWTLFVDSVDSGCVVGPLAQCAGADLSGQVLAGRDLSLANLAGANLSNANLAGTILNGADLTGANLSGVMADQASFAGANLTKANLTDAMLSQATLIQANLTGADITGVVLTSAELSDATWVDGRRCVVRSIGVCR